MSLFLLGVVDLLVSYLEVIPHSCLLHVHLSTLFSLSLLEHPFTLAALVIHTVREVLCIPLLVDSDLLVLSALVHDLFLSRLQVSPEQHLALLSPGHVDYLSVSQEEGVQLALCHVASQEGVLFHTLHQHQAALLWGQTDAHSH